MPTKKPRYVSPEEVKAREGRRGQLKKDLHEIRAKEIREKKMFKTPKLTPKQKKMLFNKTDKFLKRMSISDKDKDYLSKVEME